MSKLVHERTLSKFREEPCLPERKYHDTEGRWDWRGVYYPRCKACGLAPMGDPPRHRPQKVLTPPRDPGPEDPFKGL